MKTKNIIDSLSKIDINEKLNFDTIIKTINSNIMMKNQ
jgi:hypothetical protein